MDLLKNKTAIITGGSRGIGKSIVLTLAKHGANIVFTYLSSEEKALTVVKEAQEYGGQIIAIKSDASQYESCELLINEVSEKFTTIDILVNNAGITRDNLLLRMSEEDFDSVLSINMKSVFNMTKAIQRTMLKQRFGSIINMSSVVGVKGNAGQSNYAASKAGIIGFSKSIALELGSRNIRCNVIAPGFIETEMTEVLDEKVVQEWRDAIPLKRGGRPSDIADTCVWLGSDMSTYITGQTIHVNGGLLT